jgi:hypothetical protein
MCSVLPLGGALIETSPLAPERPGPGYNEAACNTEETQIRRTYTNNRDLSATSNDSHLTPTPQS